MSAAAQQPRSAPIPAGPLIAFGLLAGGTGLLLAAALATREQRKIAALPPPPAGAASAPRGLRLANPVPGAHVTSKFGMRLHPVLKQRKLHAGLDFAAPVGTPVRAAASGRILRVVRWDGDPKKNPAGNYVWIEHPNGLVTRYLHLSQIAPVAVVGRFVAAGDVIGNLGGTGRVTGPHLHFEVRTARGEPIDPATVIDLGDVRLAGVDCPGYCLACEEGASAIVCFAGWEDVDDPPPPRRTFGGRGNALTRCLRGAAQAA